MELQQKIKTLSSTAANLKLESQRVLQELLAEKEAAMTRENTSATTRANTSVTTQANTSAEATPNPSPKTALQTAADACDKSEVEESLNGSGSESCTESICEPLIGPLSANNWSSTRGQQSFKDFEEVMVRNREQFHTQVKTGTQLTTEDEKRCYPKTSSSSLPELRLVAQKRSSFRRTSADACKRAEDESCHATAVITRTSPPAEVQLRTTVVDVEDSGSNNVQMDLVTRKINVANPSTKKYVSKVFKRSQVYSQSAETTGKRLSRQKSPQQKALENTSVSEKSMSFREYLTANHGPQAYTAMKSVNKASMKLARQRSHLQYFEACRQHQMIPPCLVIRTTTNSDEGLRIVRDAEIRLLLEMIHNVRSNLDLMSFELSMQYRTLSQHVDDLDYHRIRRLTEAAHEKTFATVKKRQQAKIQAMLADMT